MTPLLPEGRFVVLRHETPPGAPRPTHWDLLLEGRDALRAWALAEPPDDGRPTRAEALADHRPLYLEYEGPLTDNRGVVSRCDAGRYVLLASGDGWLELALRGARLRGAARLAIAPDGPADAWRFEFTPG